MVLLGLTAWQARRLTVAGDMEPVVECLRSHGFGQRQVVKVGPMLHNEKE